MAMQSIRLDLDGDSMQLYDRNDFCRQDLIVTSLDTPSPAVRESTSPRASADGTYDVTRRHGSRAVSIELKVFDTPGTLIDQLQRFMHPAARPYLYVGDDEWDTERRMLLRSNQFGAPNPAPVGDWKRDVQLQWVAPDGVWESADPTEVMIAATGGTVTGITFPISFPITFAATAGTGQTSHTNPGTTRSDQRVRMYGPCVGPRWFNDTTGECLAFTDELAIPAGEYVEIDTRNHTAFYLSDPNADRLPLLDFEASTWWQIRPGTSRLRYAPIAAVAAGCAAAFAYRPAYF